ncbi:MAG: SDR family oxidoreductase [Planctomycetales bacterium]
MATSSDQKATPAIDADYRLSKRFQDKVCVITGPSAHGIGGAVAMRLAEEGAAVALLGRDKPSELIDRLEAAEANVYWKDCDVTSSNQVLEATKSCAQHFGTIDVLVNNAGIEVASSFEDMAEQQWQEVMEVNLLGVLRVSQAMVSHLQKSKGVIVNISSATAYAGTLGLAVYGASKAGVNGLTQSLAAEYADRKIRVVGVAPALVRTPMIAPYVNNVTSADWEQIQRCHPLGIGLPDDVAAAVAFLASADARWISGVTLPLGWMPAWNMPPLHQM